MRTWVEKLAKAIKNEGIEIGGYFPVTIKFKNYEISLYIYSNRNCESHISISELDKDNKIMRSHNIILYKDETDLLLKIFTKIQEETEDYFIEQFNNL